VRLLWVENHGVFVRVAGREFLASHEVTVVASVAAAKAALTVQRFDALMVDFDLDDGKGTALVEFVRQLPTRTAVVAVSSHDDGNTALLSAGADAACPKSRFAEIETVLQSTIKEGTKVP
jgi:DNA-binding NarL/FixJ family response regulator